MSIHYNIIAAIYLKIKLPQFVKLKMGNYINKASAAVCYMYLHIKVYGFWSLKVVKITSKTVESDSICGTLHVE